MTFGRLSLKVPFTLLLILEIILVTIFLSFHIQEINIITIFYLLFSSSNYSRSSFSFLFLFRKSLLRFLPSFIQEAIIKVLFPFLIFFLVVFVLLFSSGNCPQIIVQEHFLRALLLSTTLTWTTRARRFRWILGSEKHMFSVNMYSG